MRIFISYRRSDSPNVSGRIHDRLVEHFGEEIIFKDVDDIPFGIDFKQYLDSEVAECSVALVIIGPNWLTVTDDDGDCRLDDPADFVRLEIEAALNRDIPVIPLLVSGASMPKEHQLPTTMRKLAYRNGTPVRPDPDFHTDMNRLIKGLGSYVIPQERSADSVAHSQPAKVMAHQPRSTASMKRQARTTSSSKLPFMERWWRLFVYLVEFTVSLLVFLYVPDVPGVIYWLPSIIVAGIISIEHLVQRRWVHGGSFALLSILSAAAFIEMQNLGDEFFGMFATILYYVCLFWILVEAIRGKYFIYNR